MLNTTILQLLLSHSLKGPLLTPFSSIHISKSSFSFFSSHLLYSHFASSISQSSFSNFLSTAIKITKLDRIYERQVINSRIEVKDDRLQIIFCLFQDFRTTSGGGGGAVFISGGILVVNFTGFQNCQVLLERSPGGAVFADSNSIVFNGVCSDSCSTSDYAQSFYLLDSDSNLEYITITRCGIQSTSSFSSETILTSGAINIQNLNSTGNSVKKNAAGIFCSKNKKNSNFRVIYSSFVGNIGNSIFDISSELGDTISFTNFISNTANTEGIEVKSIISSYGINTKPTFNQCIFQSNTFPSIADGKTSNNIVSFSNCYSDNQNWGNATLSNCAITVTATFNNIFYSDGICNGNFQLPTASTIFTQPVITQPISSLPSNNTNSSDTEPEATVITSLYPLATATPFVCPECSVISSKKKDVGKIVAIVFCVLEALLIIILVIAIILLIIYQVQKNKNNAIQKEDENSEGENQFTIITENKEEKNEDNNNESSNNKAKATFYPTPHLPTSDESPSGGRRLYHEKQVTPQIPRKKRKRPIPVNEKSPLIEERKKLRIVFSSSTESDDE